jgi:hypothetical protein
MLLALAVISAAALVVIAETFILRFGRCLLLLNH